MLVSLALFSLAILLPLFGVFAAMRKINDKADERHVLGRSLLATMAGVLVTIATLSPIFFVYPLLWCLTGMAAGFPRLVTTGKASSTKKATDSDREARPRGTALPHDHR
jgi:hypothetical protein